MRSARVFVNGIAAGELAQTSSAEYEFNYYPDYRGAPVSLTMPTTTATYVYKQFPPFFEGLLPEGSMLEALVRKYKLDKNDYFGQLIQVGHDVVGAITIEEIK